MHKGSNLKAVLGSAPEGEILPGAAVQVGPQLHRPGPRQHVQSTQGVPKKRIREFFTNKMMRMFQFHK